VVVSVLNNISETNYHGSKMEIINRIIGFITQERNEAYTWAGAIGGGYFSAHLLTIHAGVWSFMNGEAIIKTTIAISMAFAIGFSTKLGAILAEEIKPKIKIFKNGRKKDEQRRA
jgi:hypothetical protein